MTNAPRPLAKLDAHPRLSLSHGPTPLESLPSLGRQLGITLWAKRDDCNGLAMGGNKVRQLEFYLGDGARQGADTVLITGARQSNFVRLTAAAARRIGWQPVVQLEDRVAKHDVHYLGSGNVLLDHLLGATVHHFPEGENEVAADRNLDAIATELRREGRNPYVIHLGSDHPPIGALGYVECARELREQLDALGVDPTHLVLPSGSGLTHAGLLVGARAMGWQVQVLGTCVRRDAGQQHPRVLRRARETAALLGADVTISDADVVVDDSMLAPGYGHINAQTREAIALAARHEGLLLDPVYTGRAMATLIGAAGTARLPAGSVVVFVHTGGTPALFAYQDDFKARES